MMMQQLHPVKPRFQRAWSARTRANPSVVVTSALGRRAVLGGLCCCSGCACSHRSQWYDKYFAYNMAVGMEDYEAAIRPVKQQLFNQLLASLPQQPLGSTSRSSSSSSASIGTGSSRPPYSVLEVGIGTGPNLPFYSSFTGASSSSSSSLSSSPTTTTSSSSSPGSGLSLTGLEPNTAMWGYAQQAAAAAGLGQQQLQLVEGDAQQMPFDSSSFDAAVMTLVMCSVPRPHLVLSELLRVLKPGGQLLLIEHVISPQLGLLQLQQRLLNPLQRLLADNCHLTRNTAALLLASSFIPQPLPPLPLKGIKPPAGGVAAGGGRRGDGDDVSFDLNGDFNGGNGYLPGGVNGSRDLWRFEVGGMGLIAPHVAGILRKPLL